MKRGYFFAAVFILAGFFITLFNKNFTGAIIGTAFLHWLDLIALAFFIMGIIALFTKSKLEKEVTKLKSGAIITNVKELKKIAKEMGYTEGKETKEGTQILDFQKHILTVIPHHKEVSQGVYQSIKKAFLTGESSFRHYYP